MTPNDFRNLALGLPGAVESAHMHHPDFRIDGKIFATLGYPDEDWGMVKLTPEQQRAFVTRAPEVFHSCRGAWGERGATNVHLASARKTLVQAALHAAFHGIKAASTKRTRTR
jgi:hypothetical protein